jgi:hypothetical protein
VFFLLLRLFRVVVDSVAVVVVVITIPAINIAIVNVVDAVFLLQLVSVGLILLLRLVLIL